MILACFLAFVAGFIVGGAVGLYCRFMHAGRAKPEPEDLAAESDTEGERNL